MKAILIDPERRTIEPIELPDNDSAINAAMRRIIGCTGLDYGVIDDMRDTIWVDEFGLTRGQPVYAFKLLRREPYAGKAVIIGADDTGATCAPYIPIGVLRNDVEWLDAIVPAVDWIEEEHGVRAVVTYRRPKSQGK